VQSREKGSWCCAVLLSRRSATTSVWRSDQKHMNTQVYVKKLWCYWKMQKRCIKAVLAKQWAAKFFQESRKACHIIGVGGEKSGHCCVSNYALCRNSNEGDVTQTVICTILWLITVDNDKNSVLKLTLWMLRCVWACLLPSLDLISYLISITSKCMCF